MACAMQILEKFEMFSPYINLGLLYIEQ
uniref:Uncharacterized protein n=1 Tax=Rhizophora mucronata TaxID=61149 RepID=A0A2P2IY46_RHIMU